MKTTIDLPESVYQSVMEQARAAGSPVSRWIEAVLTRLVSERSAKPPLEEDVTDWRSELL